MILNKIGRAACELVDKTKLDNLHVNINKLVAVR